MHKILTCVLTTLSGDALKRFLQDNKFIAELSDLIVYVNGGREADCSLYQNTRIKNLAENTGSAGGFNKIFEDFVDTDYTHLLLVEDDVTVSKKSVEKLLTHHLNEDCVRLANEYLPKETFSYHCSLYSRRIIKSIVYPNKLLFQGADDAIFEKSLKAQLLKDGKCIRIIEETYKHPVFKSKLSQGSVLRSLRNMAIDGLCRSNTWRVVKIDSITLVYLATTCGLFISYRQICDLLRWHCFSYGEMVYKSPEASIIKLIGDGLEAYLKPVKINGDRKNLMQSPNQVKAIVSRFNRNQVYANNIGVVGQQPTYYVLKMPLTKNLRSLPNLIIGFPVLLFYRIASLLLSRKFSI